MSFFVELKRRNVFKVGIAYAITSWLLIQVADILLETIGAPPWIMQTMFVVLLTGLVIALFFAWAFELTPEGVKREADVDRSQSIAPQTGQKLNRTIIAILVLALAYFVTDKFYFSTLNIDSTETVETNSSEDTQPSLQTIAVLPFVNLSADGENEYFSDGLTEELLNILAKISELRVAGRTSSFAFKGKNEDLRSIGQKLNVESILEGSVRKDTENNRVRITAQLVNVNDGFHLWSETYDRDLKDIFAIQEEIARKVAQALRITLLGEDEERITQQVKTDLSAYDLYLQGLKSFNDYRFESMNRALEEFDQAVALDANFIPAQLKRAQTWLELSQIGILSRNEAIENALPILERILASDANNSEAHSLKARALRFDKRYKESEIEFQLALDSNSRNVYALTEYGRLLFDSGKVSSGLEYLSEAGRIDPYSIQVLWNLGMASAFQQNPEETTRYAKIIGEVQPDNPMQFYGPAIAYRLNGNLAQSVFFETQAAESDPEDYELAAAMAVDWTMLGDLERAEAWARKAEQMGNDQPMPILARVMLYQAREQHQLAADLAKRALDRNLDNRNASQNAFRQAWVSNTVRKGRINEALEYYQQSIPEAFSSPLILDADSSSVSIPNQKTMQLLETANLLIMLDPDSKQAASLIDAAEQDLSHIEEGWIPWLQSVRHAAIAATRGDNAGAIEILYEAPDNRFGGRWRALLTNWFVFDPLHDEPEYQRLLAMLEQDMENQREEAYKLLGVKK